MAGVAEPELDPTLTVERVQTLDDLGQVLRRLRRRHARRHGTPELTVRELARQSGYAYGVISEYLSGKALPPTDRFDVLIRLLGASVTEQRALATARDRVEEQRRSRRTGYPVPRELPPDVFGFTGRKQALDELDLAGCRAGEAHGVVPIAVLVGTAGVGKTALAVHWAHRVAADFPDGCLYVDLRGYDPEQPVLPGEALAGFLRSLGLQGSDIPPTEAERAARYRTVTADRRLLVVLDNARDTEHVRSLLPSGCGCVAVVTSRDALTGLIARHGAHRVGVEPLSDDEAVDLLGMLLGPRVSKEPDAASALAGRCARLPLMLRLTAELATTRPEASLTELDAELADVRERLHRLDARGEPRTATSAVFSWSVQNLPAATARAFRLLGLYPGHDFDEYALAALAGTSAEQSRLLLQAMTRAHLIQPGRPNRYGIHDLLRAYAAELVGQEPAVDRQAAVDRLLDQQLAACAMAMDLFAPFDREARPAVPAVSWPVPPLTDAESAAAWLDLERPNLIATAVSAVSASGRSSACHAARLAAVLLRYLDMGAHHHDSELLHRLAAQTPAPADQAHALTGLGVVCWRLGRYQEAAVHLEHAVELARRTRDQTELGRGLIGLGIVYWHLGRTEQTLACGREALELYRGLGDRMGQARVLGNLGSVYGRLGDLTTALEHDRQALALFQELGDPAGAANSMGNIGSELGLLGQLPQALQQLHEALTLARQSGYRECEVEILDNLGVVHRRLGQVTEALDHHQQALELSRQIGDRTNEGYALGQIGTNYAHLGDHALALEYHQRALRIADELGDDHLAAELFNRLGDSLRSGDRPKRALRSYQRALSLSGRTGNRYQQAQAHHGLARTLTAIGSERAAEQHHDRALTLFTEMGVPEADTVRLELAQRQA
jgi:tetratricopeptide (TPR) repeat protein